MNHNYVSVGGNLTREVELRYTPKGTAVADFSIAINRKWKTESGEKKEEVTFLDITAFGRTAEVVAQYFGKGRPIFISGRLRTENWEDKATKQKRSKISIVCEQFQFAGDENKDGGQPASRPASASDASGPEDEEKVPF